MNPWQFLVIGYAVTIAIETPILLVGLSPRHSWKRRLFVGIWLTACTYPIVVLTMPELLQRNEGQRALYLLIAETFAPVAECTLFWLAFGERKEFGRRSMWWDFAAITAANLASFGVGEFIIAFDGWTKLTTLLF